MSNQLQEMSTVSKTDTGVEVRVRGEVERGKIDEMIGGCATGSHACCGADFFAKVESIDVAGVDGVSEEMTQQNIAFIKEHFRPPAG